MKNNASLSAIVFFIVANFVTLLLPAQASKPLSFKENKGQIHDQYLRPRPDILFSGDNGQTAFFLKKDGISYQLSRVDAWKKETVKTSRFFLPQTAEEVNIPMETTLYRVDINWLNANAPQILKAMELPDVEHHYNALCPEGALHVKSYGALTYKNIYKGIDLKWYESNGNLKYDYYVAPNTDYRMIQMEYKGAEKISVNRDGELVITTPLGIIKEEKPFVYQGSKPLPAKWIVKNNIVSFDIKNIDPSLPLVIDPMVRLWATYYGGSKRDFTYRIESDPTGNVYVSGWTSSTSNIATSGSHQANFATGTSANAMDAFLVKFNSAGVRQWATYYGGTGDDYGHEVLTNASGDVFVTGETSSPDPGAIATPGAHQSAYSAAPTNTMDAFLVKFNASGIRQWGTYYGGDDLDGAYGISLDNSGNIFMSGVTQSSTGIATPGSYQPALSGTYSGFLVKFNAAGVRQWGTYYADKTGGHDCINDASGNVYMGGYTSATIGIATPGAQQAVFGGGLNDAFFAKFDAAGSLQWSTYYGGPGYEIVNTLTVDASGNLYGAGNSGAAATLNVIATAGAHQSVYGGGVSDGYLVKFDPSGVRQWGTYYGGSGADAAGNPLIDASGNIYLSGITGTSSGTDIATPCAYQSQYGGGSTDLFIAKFTATGRRIWGSYYGSMFSDNGSGSCLDNSGNVYLCGLTLANSGSVMATSNGHQPVYGGGTEDVIIAKFDGCIAGSAVNTTPPSNLLLCPGNSTTLTASCGNWYSSPTATTVLFTGDTFTTGILTSDTTFYVEDFGCGSIVGARTPISVTLAPTPSISIVNSNPAACVGESVTLTASGAATYSWTNNPVTGPVFQLYVLLQTTYTVNGVDANGCKTSATLTVMPNLCLGINEESISTQVIAYPNPGKGTIMIRSSSEVRLTLTNELGQAIRSIHLNASANFEATLTGLANGIYYLKGEKGDHIRNQKIIVLTQ